MIKKQFGGM